MAAAKLGSAQEASLQPWTLVLMILVIALERMLPRKPFRHRIATRWVGNFGLLASNVLTGLLIFQPATWAATAVWAGERSFGLLHAYPLPEPVQIVLAVLVLDFAMWLQHWIQHRVRFLWRAHRVHHTDLDLDATSSLRFHPFETIYTTIFGACFVLFLGLPTLGVLIYVALLAAINPLTHASLRVPERLDAWITRVFVTPDFHRVHHSAHEPEFDHNYGSVFSLWDRALRTHRARPEGGHVAMDLGLEGYRDERSLHLLRLLALPFRSVRGER